MRPTLILVLFILSFSLLAQGPELTWFKRFSNFDWQKCYSLVNTNSALYMIGTDYWDFSVTKLNYDGSVVWSKLYGGTGQEVCLDGRATSDGGLILAGATKSYGAGNEDLWLLKLDGEGNHEWNSYFGTSDQERANSVQQTSDGGYIALGSRLTWYENGSAVDTYTYMVKTDSEGNLEWEKVFIGDYENAGYSVSETSDSCYIFSGNLRFSEPLSVRFRLVKTDSSGNIIWENTYGSIENGRGYCVIETSDEGFIAIGFIEEELGEYEIYVVKTDAAGNELWNQTFGGKYYYNSGRSVIEAFEGGFTVTGTIWNPSSQPKPECFLRKIDPNGNTEWHIVLDGSTSGGEHGYGLVQLSDGGYAVGGYIYTDTLFQDDAFIARLSPPEGIEHQELGRSSNISISSISPNPLQSITEVTLSLQETSYVQMSVIDLSGRKIADIQAGLLQSGETTLTWNASNSSNNPVPPGIYILRVCSQGTELTKKLAVLR